jgi:hypothetical protein
MFKVPTVSIIENIKNDDVETVKHYLKRIPERKSLVFLNVCRVGAFKTARMLLDLHGYDYSIDTNEGIQLASESGHAKIISLLLKHPKTDHRRMGKWCIQYACEHGHTDVVDILLKNHRINPFVNNCLQISIKNKHYNIAKLLLGDSRIYASKKFRSLYTFCKIHENTFHDNGININNDVLFVIKIKLAGLILKFQL